MGDYVAENHNSYKKIVIEPTRVVIFQADGAEWYSCAVPNGTTVEAPADPEKDGYTFLGWYTDDGNLFDFDTPITADITLTAKFEPATGTGLKGDVDGDGNITSTDARLTLQFYAGKIGEESLNTAVADVDSDVNITSTDARLILQYYAGKITAWP